MKVDFDLGLPVQLENNNYSINKEESVLFKSLEEYIERQSNKKEDSIRYVISRCTEFISFLKTYSEKIVYEKNLLLKCLQEKINCN